MGAAIGYDDTSRSIVIFGGQTSGGFAQSETFLLNLETLTWSTPDPPQNLGVLPPARSAAVAGTDFAASNRQGFVVIGGKGPDGNPLSDVWEFDFTNHFWSNVSISPGGPSPRWGAAGGIDNRIASVQDPILQGPNNTFYFAGGYSNGQPQPLSDVWKLSLSGTLSSNLPNNVFGSWQHVKLGSLPPRVDIASTVLFQEIVVVGGCNNISTNDSCARPDSFIIDALHSQSQSPKPCASARKGGVLLPNLNSASSSFSSQVFLLLGNFDSSLWQDGGNLSQGEVDVLDTNTGLWTRVLPAGDPGSSGKVTYPSPREGASAVTYKLALVGQARTIASDTLVFGGRDASGTYLPEVWILRAYSAAVTPSNSTWDGFGNGQLQTGPNATGTGVRNKILTECATSVTPSNTPSPTGSPGGSDPGDSDSGSSSSVVQTFEVSFYHKLFAPLSVLLAFPALLLYKLSFPPSSGVTRFPALFISVVAYGIGLAGIITSFTSISRPPSALAKRSSSSNILKTAHGQAGLAMFVGFYGLLPLLHAFSTFFYHWRRVDAPLTDEPKGSAEKLAATTSAASPSPSLLNPSRSGSPRPRTQSWGPSSLFRHSHEGRLSSDSESNLSSPPQRTFEVLNRPPRRHPDHLTIPSSSGDSSQRSPRGLTEVDWLQRRRSLNAVGELDYAITQALRSQQPPSTPATTDVLMAHSKPPHTPLPPMRTVALHILFHAFLIALCILSLVALWAGAPTALFAVFLVYVLAFYTVIFVLAFNGRPSNSTLTLIISRIRGDYVVPRDISDPSSPRQEQEQQYPFPSSTGPYVHHQPPFRAGPDSPSHEMHRTEDEDDDDEDEDTRQRRIEDEMERRDVSIVTVPKRKLWITNPS